MRKWLGIAKRVAPAELARVAVTLAVVGGLLDPSCAASVEALLGGLLLPGS